MSDKLIFALLVVGIVLLLTIIFILKKGRMPIKFAIVWLIPSVALILLALIPEIFIFFANITGFLTISNLVVGILFVILFYIIMALTIIIAGQTTKINLLIQEISILKKKIDDVNL